MSAAYLPTSRRRGGLMTLVGSVDDFMSWLLYGQESWLVAVLKAVPLFLFMYFLLFYIPNYIYYGLTLYIPFLKFSKDVGFLVANLIGGGNQCGAAGSHLVANDLPTAPRSPGAVPGGPRAGRRAHRAGAVEPLPAWRPAVLRLMLGAVSVGVGAAAGGGAVCHRPDGRAGLDVRSAAAGRG
jgi:hypothetical protein